MIEKQLDGVEEWVRRWQQGNAKLETGFPAVSTYANTTFDSRIEEREYEAGLPVCWKLPVIMNLVENSCHFVSFVSTDGSGRCYGYATLGSVQGLCSLTYRCTRLDDLQFLLISKTLSSTHFCHVGILKHMFQSSCDEWIRSHFVFRASRSQQLSQAILRLRFLALPITEKMGYDDFYHVAFDAPLWGCQTWPKRKKSLGLRRRWVIC